MTPLAPVPNLTVDISQIAPSSALLLVMYQSSNVANINIEWDVKVSSKNVDETPYYRACPTTTTDTNTFSQPKYVEFQVPRLA